MIQQFTLSALSVLALAAMAAPANANSEAKDPTLVHTTSPYSVQETIDRVVEIVERQGGKVFARVDHAKNAESVFQELRPTEALIFGNPKAGTPLMQTNQEMGLDLPVRLLAYEDAEGAVHLVYRDPHALAKPHGVAKERKLILDRISETLAKLTAAATKPEE